MTLADVCPLSLLVYHFLRTYVHDTIASHICYHPPKMDNLFSNSIYKIGNSHGSIDFLVADEFYCC